MMHDYRIANLKLSNENFFKIFNISLLVYFDNFNISIHRMLSILVSVEE